MIVTHTAHGSYTRVRGKDLLSYTSKQGTGMNHQNAFCHVGNRRRDLHLVLLLFLLHSSTLSRFSVAVAPSDNLAEQISEYIPFDVSTDGHANLREGSRLFQLKRYDEASAYFWRAVLLQEKAGRASVSCPLRQHSRFISLLEVTLCFLSRTIFAG